MSQKFSIYSDESGQDTRGRKFVVCSVLVNNDIRDELEQILLNVERKSGKNEKWYNTSNKYRQQYWETLGKDSMFDHCRIMYTIYLNKADYIQLTGSHIAKTVLKNVTTPEYKVKVFIDKITKAEIEQLRNEIKSYKIRYQKIVGIADEASPFIRLADAACGLIRDLNNKNCPEIYQKAFKKFIQI